jgi:putative DNA primase/helicase
MTGGGDDPRSAFRDAIRNAGLTPPEVVEPDGRLHRFASNRKRGDDSGWYVFHEDGIPAVAFGDWRSGLSRTWRADIGRDLTPAELVAHQARVDAAHRAREVEEARRHAEAASRAAAIWKASRPATSDHRYLTGKRIQPHGARLYRGSLVLAGLPCDGSLIVPMRDVHRVIHSLQFISEDGIKRFLPDGRVQECYFSIGQPRGRSASARALLPARPSARRPRMPWP